MRFALFALLLFSNQAEAEREPAAKGGAASEERLAVDAAVDEVMRGAVEVVRVALVPVRDDDEARARRVETALLRALLERQREEVVTPSRIRAVLQDALETAVKTGEMKVFGALAADHALLSEVSDAGGERTVQLRLIDVETGLVVGQSEAKLPGEARSSRARAQTVRGAVSGLVDDLVIAIEAMPGEIRYQRVAVLPPVAETEPAKKARLDRFVQAQLTKGLRERGFLVVERAQLDKALAQMALGAELGEDDAPEVGKLLDAQALVFGTLAETGPAFRISVRAVSTQTAEVLGAFDAEIPREGLLSLASDAIETRTPEEAVFRSLIAPGWGQLYNRRPGKGLLFAGLGYGAAFTTVGLGIAAAVSFGLYSGYRPADGTPDAEVPKQVQGLRQQTNAFLMATAIAGVLTGAVWAAGVADAYLDGLAFE